MRFSALVLTIAVLGCSDATSPSRSLAPAGVTREVVLNQRDSMPLFLIACNGEAVTGTMLEHQILSFTLPKNGSTIAFYSADYKFTGTGGTTGAQYQGTLSLREQGMSGTAANVFATISRLQVVSQSNIPNTLIDFSTRATVNANGDVVVDHTNFSSSCQ